MCSECFQYPCHPRCPNADEPDEVGRCEICNRKILEGDDVYKLLEVLICEDCVIDAHTYAERDD